MDIHGKLEYAEIAFQKFLSNEYDEKTFCKELSTILSSFDDNQYEVLISNQNGKEPFYGMRIFPALTQNEGTDLYEQEMNLLTGTTNEEVSFKVCYNFWSHNKKWVLEIDANALDNTKINLTPKELLAMVLHEQGHVIYSSKALERFYNAFMDMKSAQSLQIKNVMKPARFLFYPVMIAACKYRSWVVGKDEKRIEFFADKNVVDNDYGEYLQSAFGKVVKYFGRTDARDNTTADAEAKWSADLVAKLTARHNRVSDEIYIKAARTSSKYIRAIYRSMLSKLGVVSKNKYTGIQDVLPAEESLFAESWIMENDLVYTIDSQSMIYNYCNIASQKAERALEGFIRKNKTKQKDELDDLQYDIDKVMVDIDKISSHHDRIYVLDLIYNIKEKLSEWEDRLNEFPHLKSKYGSKIESMNHQVADLRKVVLSKNNFDKRYEVFVKYPVGYEG